VTAANGQRPPSLFGPRGGFTLVELLTVIAIIAVLGTLLLTALSSAQKKSREARCTSNLRQIGLALIMYLDDFDQRARQLYPLTKSKYLPAPEVLVCPQDKTGNWGRLVSVGWDSFLPAGGLTPEGDSGMTNALSAEDDSQLRYSYLHPLPWDDAAWNRLMKAGGLAGLAACQVHGLGKANLQFPSIYDFQGLLLRAQRDGAVVRRKVFWPAGRSGLGPPFGGGVTMGDAGAQPPAAGLYPWALFLDEAELQQNP
jgi:prepilin-type N-terminal cleavage/methylation domain-containing protein